MALQTKSVISFYVLVTNNFVVLGTPIQQPFVTNRLSFSSLPFIIRADELTEIVTVGEVKSNVIGVESLSQICEFPFKDVENNAEVTSDCNEVITPVQFCFSRLTSAVGIEVSINTEVGISDSLPNSSLLLLLRRGGL